MADANTVAKKVELAQRTAEMLTAKLAEVLAIQPKETREWRRAEHLRQKSQDLEAALEILARDLI